MYQLGAVGVPDTTTIASNKQYTFTFSSWSTKDTITGKVNDLLAYAKNITVAKDGLTKATISLVPLYAMPLSAWRDQFSRVGLSDMTDVYVGSVVADQKFEFANPITYWEPKVAAAGSWLGDTLSGAFGYVKILAIAGAVIVGGVVILTYLPKPRYKDNPKRR